MSVQVQVFQDQSLSVVPTSFQIVAEGVTRGVRAANKQALKDLYQYSAQFFEESIERPATSVTAGGRAYRAGDRATGNFTFGDSGTFKGHLFESGPVQGIGFPDIERADQRTDKAWRVLEQGTESLRMPSGFWRDAGGNRVPPTLGGDDEFHPAGGRGFREVSGITAKWFIRDAISLVREELELEYKIIGKDIVEGVKRFKAPAPSGLPPPPGKAFTVWVAKDTITKTGPAAGYKGYWRRPPGSG